MYAIEGHELRPVFKGLYVDEGKELAPAPVLPRRRIEFIGNSITCGYGIESEDRDAPFTYNTENHYYTYAALTARALQAQHLVVARSGIGVYRNYGSPASGSGDGEVYRFDMSPQTGSLGYAPGWHPTMRQHRKMAVELTSYLKKLMNW